VPFRLAQVDEIVRLRRRQIRKGIVFHEREAESVSTEPLLHPEPLCSSGFLGCLRVMAAQVLLSALPTPPLRVVG
jgi:hypothetical protein